jgi:methylated-DNA-[protein]-cysteine S-methyltransferase
MSKYAVINTELGWVGIGGSERGLIFLTLPKPSSEEVLSEIEILIPDKAHEDYLAFGDLPQRLQRYFKGERVTFPDRLDLSNATAFQRTVWSLTRAIPYGETRSYAWVAQQIGRPQALRAVGGALARNRFHIIVPCHRVIAASGSLGGFGGGLKLKKLLLDLEAKQISQDRI